MSLNNFIYLNRYLLAISKIILNTDWEEIIDACKNKTTEPTRSKRTDICFISFKIDSLFANITAIYFGWCIIKLGNMICLIKENEQ